MNYNNLKSNFTMRLILKKERKRPKAPKTATKTSLDNYAKKLREVEAYNASVRKYNRELYAMAQRVQKAVSGFGKGCGKKGKK